MQVKENEIYRGIIKVRVIYELCRLLMRRKRYFEKNKGIYLKQKKKEYVILVIIVVKLQLIFDYLEISYLV